MIRRIVFLMLAFSPPVFATEWFVSPTGNDDSGNGTIDAPFRTVMHVLNTSHMLAASGDILTLRGPAGNNVYNECNVRVRVPLTVRSYPGELAHIHCDMSVDDSVVLQFDPGADGSSASNLELSGSAYYGVKLNTNWYTGGGEDESGVTNVVLDHLKVHDTGRDAIKVTPKADHITIRNSEIWNSGAIYPPGTPQDDRNAEGIDNVNGSFMLVEDNYIHDIASTGVYCKGGATDCVIQRNRIVNAGSGGIRLGFDTSPEFFDLTVDPQYYESIRAIARNNYVANTYYAGISVYASLDAVVANNTIVNTAEGGQAGLYFGISFQDGDADAGRPPSVNPLLRNNVVMQNGGDCLAIRYVDEDDLGPLSALTGSPETDSNTYYSSTGPCNFVDQRPGSGITNGTDLAGWIAAEGTDARSFEAAIAVDDAGHLLPGSRAIDAGETLDVVTDDIDHGPRTAPYDIGCDESGVSGYPDQVFVGEFD
jgi:hypothetical protein